MRRFRSIILLAALLILVRTGSALACRCEVAEPWNPDVDAARDRADFVFFGQAVSRSGFEEGIPVGYRYWTFDIAAVWKGPVSQMGRVYAHAESNLINSCDREFQVGVNYIVFAYLEPSTKSVRFRDGVCSLTAPVSEEKSFSHEIVRRLGPPSAEPPK